MKIKKGSIPSKLSEFQKERKREKQREKEQIHAHPKKRKILKVEKHNF